MHWNALILAAVIGAPAAAEPVFRSSDTQFDNYTQAWHAAKGRQRPMLVILNPPSNDSLAPVIDGDKLLTDEQLGPLLDSYVVTVVDTGTEHGKKVNELFGSKPLPRIVVIDNQQKTQVFGTSDRISEEHLAEVLEHYRSGDTTPVNFEWARSVLPASNPTNCPSCQQTWQLQ